MAERDGAAIGIDPRIVIHQSKLPKTGKPLRGERFVQLDQVDAVERNAGTVEQEPHRRHRFDAHHARLDPGPAYWKPGWTGQLT